MKSITILSSGGECTNRSIRETKWFGSGIEALNGAVNFYKELKVSCQFVKLFRDLKGNYTVEFATSRRHMEHIPLRTKPVKRQKRTNKY